MNFSSEVTWTVLLTFSSLLGYLCSNERLIRPQTDLGFCAQFVHGLFPCLWTGALNGNTVCNLDASSFTDQSSSSVDFLIVSFSALSRASAGQDYTVLLFP